MSDILNSSVISASITAFFSFALGVFTAWFRQRGLVREAQNEIHLQSESLDFAAFVDDWGEIQKEIDNLTQITTLDRFLIFRAWNGSLEPRWTTAVFQMRKGNQEHISYVHFEIDNDYVQRLKKITNGDDIYFAVDDIPPSLIKSVYINEGVKASYWAHINSKQVDAHSKTITYCCFATQDEQGFDENTRTRFKILLGRLRNIAVRAE